MGGRPGAGGPGLPWAYCLILSSRCFFLKVLFDPTRVSSNAKRLATSLLRAVSGAAVSLVRHRDIATHVTASAFSVFHPVGMGPEHEQYLKVYLVALLFLPIDALAHSQVCLRGQRNPVYRSPVLNGSSRRGIGTVWKGHVCLSCLPCGGMAVRSLTLTSVLSDG